MTRVESRSSIDPFAKQLTGIKLEKSQLGDAIKIAFITGAGCSVIIAAAEAVGHTTKGELGMAALRSVQGTIIAGATVVVDDLRRGISGRGRFIH
ncbi:MAG: hypothetical protein ACM3IJ_04005 [Candidatus Levyibacteriota bacterium]